MQRAKELLNPNQLNIFENTETGFVPAKEVDFCGSNYDNKIDRHRLNTKLLKVLNIIKNWGEFTNAELYKVTRTLAINDDTASRCVRKISEINYMGYFVIKNENKTPITFKCIKLDK